MPPFIIGMGDVSGSVRDVDRDSRSERAGRATGRSSWSRPTCDSRRAPLAREQQADFAITSCQGGSRSCKRYFANRDRQRSVQLGSGWGWSNYDFVRFHSWKAGDGRAAATATLIFMTKAEMDMLQAEGHHPQGQLRARGGADQHHARAERPARDHGIRCDDAGAGWRELRPEGSGRAVSTTVACGNMMEAMKWEKRIETAYTHFAPWYLDGRGWGDLAEGTPLFWAVPYQDLQARGYSTTRSTARVPVSAHAPDSGAPKGTYGW